MTNNKRDILIIMGRYLPGYKDGGPVRSIKNLVDYLGDEYNFKILTCDRDHGDKESYQNININDWNKVGNAEVYYVPPKKFRMSTIKKLSEASDLVYCCGCFNDYSIKTLILNRLGYIKVPVVIASMGLFSPNEFNIKYFKKKAFITTFSILGMFKNIYWSATSELESKHISEKIRTYNNIYIAEDLPRKIECEKIIKYKQKGKLKLIWLSRIAPNKNLEGVINILKNVKSEIEFDIYGPKHSEEYWNKCQNELEKLPTNIKWDWKGNLESEKVIEVFKQYHVFLFMTLGENYGHVIHESLSAGCPVILSDNTPWTELEENNAGFVYSLDSSVKFVNAIEKYSSMDNYEFQEQVDKTLEYIINVSNEKVNTSGYRNIFNNLVLN